MMSTQRTEHSETTSSSGQQQHSPTIMAGEPQEQQSKDTTASTSPRSLEDGPLLEALGVNADGKCIRHPNCPVLDIGTSEVIPCRICFSEEKSVGIRQSSGTFQTVVQELHRHHHNNSLNGSNSSLLSAGGGGNNAAVTTTTTTPSSPAQQQYCHEEDLPPLESVVKRLTQVQNWMLRQKEREVLSLQLRINQLEQQLTAERTSNGELKNTVKSLRKTIQQDLRVIKHMQELSPQKTPSGGPNKAVGMMVSSGSAYDSGGGAGSGGSSGDERQQPAPDRQLERAFQSFRGGLLDIPKSPPPVQHTEKRHRKVDTKLQLNTDAVKALRLRTLSRNNSAAIGGGSSHSNNGSKEISLDVLAAKLSEIPVQRTIAGQSPEQFFPDTIASHPGMPRAQLLHDVEEEGDDEVILEEENEEDDNEGSGKPLGSSSGGDAAANKTVFTVTGAVSQDKFGDQGRYSGQILVTTGLPHGKGVMEYDSGRVYDGDWVSGQWHGKGKLQNPNGDSYEGEFCLDARHGTGLYKWDNGDVYTGEFRSDKRHGKGTFAFFNGNKYHGEFNNGMFQGYGKYEFAGGYYEGEWKEGRYHGNGELLYANGGKYAGEFRNSVAHGFGMEVLPDGTKRRGVWSDGKPTEVFDNKEDEQD